MDWGGISYRQKRNQQILGFFTWMGTGSKGRRVGYGCDYDVTSVIFIISLPLYSFLLLPPPSPSSTSHLHFQNLPFQINFVSWKLNGKNTHTHTHKTKKLKIKTETFSLSIAFPLRKHWSQQLFDYTQHCVFYYLPLGLSLSLPLCLRLSLSLSVPLSVSVSLSASVRVCMCVVGVGSDTGIVDRV